MKRGLDKLTKERRSWNMSRIRGKDTKPELVVRSLLHRMGYRFRLHVQIPVGGTRSASPTSSRRKQLGTCGARPSEKSRKVSVDILLPKYKTAIFVHGCFWHRHKGCKNCTTPTNRREWWLAKLNGNAERDKLNKRALEKLGWRTVVVWECQTNLVKTADRLRELLSLTQAAK
jgi:DNA mismatch endonuclease (patch repair protein)